MRELCKLLSIFQSSENLLLKDERPVGKSIMSAVQKRESCSLAMHSVLMVLLSFRVGSFALGSVIDVVRPPRNASLVGGGVAQMVRDPL